MANGDEAAAVGMDVVAGTDDIRQGYSEINKSRDYLAQHRTSGTHDASQIATGVLPAARGGTGHGSVYQSVHDGDPAPGGPTRLVTVAENGNLFGLRGGDIDPAYLGFQIYMTGLNGVDFDDNGGASVEHGCPFDPAYIIVQARMDAFGQIGVYVTTRSENPPWDDTVVLLRARQIGDGSPYTGTVGSIMLLAFGGA